MSFAWIVVALVLRFVPDYFNDFEAWLSLEGGKGCSIVGLVVVLEPLLDAKLV